MASIFTYDPDPPRVASPWLEDFPDAAEESQSTSVLRSEKGSVDALSNSLSPFDTSGGRKVTRLQAEPQEGPVEYKLHLLLRPRRKFRSTSTGSFVPGSRHSKLGNGQPSRSISEAGIETAARVGATTPPPSSTHQTRQHRLEQLTTQLLWRLQQSSPHHTSSATNMILPSLPEALPELQAPQQPAKLLHGLEESRGALYEIGVSDDGTLIGLAEDEMQESLNNLRAMAACLGCTVEELRRETVGDCEWLDDVVVGRKQRRLRRTGKLIVAEALVKPSLATGSPRIPAGEVATTGSDILDARNASSPSTEQLRVTLTGPTMSGKSTLLGTLTMSTFDNGRGKSRLSMLKHRHEINSGITSSVTQELLGYQDGDKSCVEIINYASENIASWIDVHVASSGNRLVFISDSAGHPRYRRTTFKGLVGWSPHWTLLCIPADDTEDTGSKSGSTRASQQSLGSAVSDMDLSGAQLELCLRLNLPLVIVITKLDLASKAGLKSTLTKVLDVLKAAGRKPAIMPNSTSEIAEEKLHTVGADVIDSAYQIALPILNDPVGSVPIVLTSAVQGTGIMSLHALLHELPILEQESDAVESSNFRFHIEDIYNKPAEGDAVIVSGLLRSGQISVGDVGTIGPFSTHDTEDSENSEDRPERRPTSQLPTSRSFPGALREIHLVPPHFQLQNQEWRRFKVSSIRNLRLPVHSLIADQVGTIAIVPDDPKKKPQSASGFGRIRKGMVLTTIQPQASRSFSGEFKREDLESLAVGNHVVVYIASVRASARVVSARAPDSPISLTSEAGRESDGNNRFAFDDVEVVVSDIDADEQNPQVAGIITAPMLVVTFNFDASKEFVNVGDQVLVMPGGGPGLYGGHERGEKGVAGLEGFVGGVVETFN